jgi:hypothetical protein
MPLDLSAFDRMMPKAVAHFWKARALAAGRQKERGIADQGSRTSVTAGKNLDGFVAMVRELVISNGLDKSDVCCDGRALATIPGYYRPTKNWDLLIISRGRLVAAIEFKSQVGPSFGNNFSNRVQEALGSATDVNAAFREGAFGESTKPFLGYFFVVEECPKSTTPVKFASPHFPAMPDFENTSDVDRYNILCRKLVQEQLYDAAALLLTDKATGKAGKFRVASELTDPMRFARAGGPGGGHGAEPVAARSSFPKRLQGARISEISKVSPDVQAAA